MSLNGLRQPQDRPASCPTICHLLVPTITVMPKYIQLMMCLQYHEVVGYLCGRPLGWVTAFFVMLNVFGLCVAQVVACSSDAYYWRTSLDKRCTPLC